jgi:hypothetical protein
VDYSLFYGGVDGVDVGEVGEASGATPAVFLPLIFDGTSSVYVFRVSLPPPLGNTERGLYIGVLRSS